MRVLVTGGAGFIGSHLCEKLLALNHQVYAVDNFITGRRSNMETFIHNPGFKFFEHDIIQPFDADPGNFEAIFHLASPASPVGYTRYPIETHMVNSVGTYNMLKLALACKAKFLVTSTSEAYGDPLEHPQREEYWGNVNPVGPRSCYDESKRFAESITMEYVRQFGLDARIVRLFNTYGPRNDPTDGRVVPNFINQALNGEPLTVFGDGLQTRSFAFVSDTVDGLLKAMFTENTSGEIFNLGNPGEWTMLDFAQNIISQINPELKIIFLPARPDDPGRRCPDISKAGARLGWEPVVSLEDGLSQTINYFRQEKKKRERF